MNRSDLEQALAQLRRDPLLAPLITRHGPPRWRAPRGTFQALCRSIIYQQLSGKAAGTIYRRFRALYPGRPFPTPAELRATRVARLQRAGLSRQKASYVRDLARKFDDGTIEPRGFRHRSDEELKVELTQIRGVGPWTVDMLLMFTLRRPDVLPVGDLGVQKGFQLLFQLDELPDPATMVALAQRWSPWRSLASWYLWRLVEEQRPLR